MATIFMAGDSTMQRNDYTTYPQVGWGQAFELFINPVHTICNYARNGRSTKSFITDGRLERIKKEIQAGDFLFIQFSHNDNKPEDLSRHTEPYGTYQENLRLYCKVAKEAGAYPLLLTSVTRRYFTEEGKIEELQNGHGEYPEAMKQVAIEENIPFIDLYCFSKKVVEELGEEKSKNLYMYFEAGEYGNYPEGIKDNTHLRMDGAMVFSNFIAEEVQKLGEPYISLILTEEESQKYLDMPY